MTYNVHAGHCPQGQGAYGATGILKESVEDRIVKNEVIRLLRENGETVYDCTCDENTTQSGCLNKIITKCNQHRVKYDISIHLNSGRNDYNGDNSTGGVEVICYDYGTIDVAKAIADNISKEFGYRLRTDNTTPRGYNGVKINKGLRVLNSTVSPAFLIECCFVDDADDVMVWNAKKCAKAIAEGVLGKKVSDGTNNPNIPSVPQSTPPYTGDQEIKFTYAVKAGGKILPEVVNLNDWAGLKDGTPITDIAIKVNNGSVRYRVHIKGGNWLPWVTGYNWNDHNNGYAGNEKAIDAVQVYYNTPSDYAKAYGYKKAQYRVSSLNNTGYYPWQYDDEKGNGMDGYAGAFGVAIDKFQLCAN